MIITLTVARHHGGATPIRVNRDIKVEEGTGAEGRASGVDGQLAIGGTRASRTRSASSGAPRRMPKSGCVLSVEFLIEIPWAVPERAGNSHR